MMYGSTLLVIHRLSDPLPHVARAGYLVLLPVVQAQAPHPTVYRYNICNGLSNQLLFHAASIAIAVEQGKEVEIPNHFIVNGVQQSDEPVLPSEKNSIPFGVAFDAAYFRQAVQELGIHTRFVSFDFTRRQIPCAGMQSLHQANPRLVLQILKAFRPSERLSVMISGITDALEERGVQEGICLHHRDGQDWYDHCSRWSSIDDGIYRGNCLGVPGRTFVQSLEDRGLTGSRWIYYCGDHEVPKALRSLKSPYQVVSRTDLMSYSDRQAVASLKEGSPVRDLWALIDFYACNSLSHFIGNSVSTFSAIQIALRESDNTFWYNSQSIPMGDIWRAYQIPIVYTYTELSKKSGKHLLQASITSVKKHMPHNKIHILYHGKQDRDFRRWLSKRGVTIHQHDPSWRGQIEAMRKHGDPNSSHLFLHSGNYFGTWQRIDIPSFINSEYCLLLDADTIVVRPFTLADFGLDMTYGIALSAENTDKDIPMNAGVMLMNIPRLRETYNEFIEFILEHVHSAKFDNPSPSDQGAYLDFYENDIRFLSRRFNFKPYYKLPPKSQSPFIIHFHGAKPHDYLKFIMGEKCDQAIDFLCANSFTLPYLCQSIQHFAAMSLAVDQVAYCKTSFDKSEHVFFCNEMMTILAQKKDECRDLSIPVEVALESVPDSLQLSKVAIWRRTRRALWKKTVVVFSFFALVCMAVATVFLRNHWRRNAPKGRHDH